MIVRLTRHVSQVLLVYVLFAATGVTAILIFVLTKSTFEIIAQNPITALVILITCLLVLFTFEFSSSWKSAILEGAVAKFIDTFIHPKFLRRSPFTNFNRTISSELNLWAGSVGDIVADESAIAIAIFDPKQRLVSYNRAFARLWNFEETDISDMPHIKYVADVYTMRFGDEPIWQMLAAKLSSISESENSGKIERPGRRDLWISLTPLPDSSVLVVFIDVGKHFEIERSLLERNNALEVADELKSDFIHHASFLLRDPLNVILGNAEILASGDAGQLEPRHLEMVRGIRTAASTLAGVVTDILDLAMIESNATLELSRVDLYGLLSRVAEPLCRQAEPFGIYFLLECPRDVGTVVVDQRRIRQVVFNLLSNAFRLTPRGGRITLGGKIENGDVQIWVSDSGPSIASMEKVGHFNRFAANDQPGGTSAKNIKGLELVNSFVELHNGWVEIEENPGGGSTVCCHLPIDPTTISPSQESKVLKYKAG